MFLFKKHTLLYSNMAMENTFIGDFPIETSISNGYPVATFDYRRVYSVYSFANDFPLLSKSIWSWYTNVSGKRSWIKCHTKPSGTQFSLFFDGLQFPLHPNIDRNSSTTNHQRPFLISSFASWRTKINQTRGKQEQTLAKWFHLTNPTKAHVGWVLVVNSF